MSFSQWCSSHLCDLFIHWLYQSFPDYIYTFMNLFFLSSLLFLRFFCYFSIVIFLPLFYLVSQHISCYFFFIVAKILFSCSSFVYLSNIFKNIHHSYLANIFHILKTSLFNLPNTFITKF